MCCPGAFMVLKGHTVSPQSWVARGRDQRYRHQSLRRIGFDPLAIQACNILTSHADIPGCPCVAATIYITNGCPVQRCLDYHWGSWAWENLVAPSACDLCACMISNKTNIRPFALNTAIQPCCETHSQLSKLRIGHATTKPEHILVADAELASGAGERG